MPTVIDITNANRPVQLTPQVTSNSGSYDIALQVPFSRGGLVGGQHMFDGGGGSSRRIGGGHVREPSLAVAHATAWG